MEQKLCQPCEEPDVDKQPPCPLQCRSPKCKAYQRKVRLTFGLKYVVT